MNQITAISRANANNSNSRNNSDDAVPDFCFGADVLSQIDAVDIAEAFGLLPVDSDVVDVAAVLADMARATGFVDDDGDVFASVVSAATVASRKR